MKRLAYALAVIAILWSASSAFADCNRLEYGGRDPWLGTCNDLGVPLGAGRNTCTDEMLATAKAGLDWVLFDNTAALEAYRASLHEQIACGYPPLPLTYFRAALVAVQPHDPLAQCMLLFCDLKIDFYMQDLEKQGKLPED